ncbi:MAG: ketol-acid reductoisomerase [candidate division Zixibacteria bacterium]|nr:ketol-acid reductoisomerase [candidate division Zixibacteria bacterium]
MASGRIKIIPTREIKSVLLKNLKIAVIGYGSQGKAQALNLRDSGFMPIIGLPSKSRSRKIAKKDGFTVATPAKATRNSDLISILIPDHKHKELFNNELCRVIKKDQVFIFAHSLSVHFKLVKQPKDVDFILVAPHSPGIRLREKYLSGEGVLAFIGQTEASSKKSLNIAAAYAKAIGCARKGVIATTFAEEAIGDIFGEQAVLCGGLSALLKAGFDTLIEAGLPPQNAYIECVYQLDLIVDLIKKYGIAGMYDKISATAAFGSFQAEDMIINKKSKSAMNLIMKKVKAGKFADELLDDYSNSFKKLKAYKKEKRHPNLDKMALFFTKRFDN